MDVFYYWENFDSDLKAGRMGAFKSSADKLRELADGHPDYIWAFRTPKGRKSELQLLARLRCTDRRAPGEAIGYDMNDAASVLYSDSHSDAHITSVSDWVARNFPKLRTANFQGVSGQEALRGAPLKELTLIAARLANSPLRPTAAAN